MASNAEYNQLSNYLKTHRNYTNVNNKEKKIKHKKSLYKLLETNENIKIDYLLKILNHKVGYKYLTEGDFAVGIPLNKRSLLESRRPAYNKKGSEITENLEKTKDKVKAALIKLCELFQYHHNEKSLNDDEKKSLEKLKEAIDSFKTVEEGERTLKQMFEERTTPNADVYKASDKAHKALQKRIESRQSITTSFQRSKQSHSSKTKPGEQHVTWFHIPKEWVAWDEYRELGLQFANISGDGEQKMIFRYKHEPNTIYEINKQTNNFEMSKTYAVDNENSNLIREISADSKENKQLNRNKFSS